MSIFIENLTAGYGQRPVLKNINLTVTQGQITALLGRNGCGKTTLLRCVNALIAPSTGRVLLDGQDPATLSRQRIARLVSVVPQSAQANFDFTCLEVVLMGEAARLSLWGTPGKKQIREAHAIFEQVGILPLAKRSFNELSGGERQMVLLARALFQKSPYMLLDEPNSHLDFANQHQIMALVRQIVKKAGLTVLVTLHDPNLALYYCDEAVLLHQGQLLTKGKITRVLTEEYLTRIYGPNIQIDYSRQQGLPIVLPKHIIDTPMAGRAMAAM